MTSPKLTREERIELRHETVETIQKLERTYANEHDTELINRFLNKFNVCETAYKVILRKHQEKKGKSPEPHSLKLNMSQVPYALSFAGYDFSKECLNEIFGSKLDAKPPKKTLKKMRDALTHGIDQAALTELQNREIEIFTMMNTFLSSLKQPV